MRSYELYDIICLDGWCKAHRFEIKTRQCCSTCQHGENCPDRCKKYKQPCDSMEYYKNTEHGHGEFWRKDGVVSVFVKKDDGTRWWIISDEYAFGTRFIRCSEPFHSEEDAKKWASKFSKETKICMITGKFTTLKENP